VSIEQWGARKRRFQKGLRREMKRQGYSYRQLAERAQMDHSAIWRIAKGQRTPGDDTARKIAKALDVPLGELIA
jgi:transcriptional regulator with XRE-family HTH domain